MIVTYREIPCNFSFLESGVLQNKDDDKIDDIFIYHAHTFGLLYSLYLGYEKLEVVSPQEKKKDHQEINATTPTNFHSNHSNHEGVVECPRKKEKIHMQRNYSAATFLDYGDLAPFFGSIELRTTPFHEEEDDVHMSSHTYTIESRTTPFQEWEDDVDIPQVTQGYALSTQAHAFQGPITRSRAKKLQHEVRAFLDDINFNTSENVILPKCYTLVVLKYICEEDASTLRGTPIIQVIVDETEVNSWCGVRSVFACVKGMERQQWTLPRDENLTGTES
jgi:hypothetical protein